MMKKIIRLLKSRGSGGFTLVEVVVSCAMLGILVVGMFSLVTPILSNLRTIDQGGRSLMIAESIDTYINRSTRYSIYVGIVENALPSDVGASGFIADPDNEASKMLKEMIDYRNNNASSYDIKCIGIRYLMDSRTQEYKYVLTNETLKINYLELSNTKMVFENCFYDNFYPKISLEILTKTVENADGTTTTVKYPSIKLMTDIYDGVSMQNISFKGVGYIDYINVRAGSDSADNIKIVKAHEDSDFEAGGIYEGQHPDTYIYYVTRTVR